MLWKAPLWNVTPAKMEWACSTWFPPLNGTANPRQKTGSMHKKEHAMYELDMKFPGSTNLGPVANNSWTSVWGTEGASPAESAPLVWATRRALRDKENNGMCYEFLFFLFHCGPEALIPGSGKHHRVMQREEHLLAEPCKWAPERWEREGSRDFLFIPLSISWLPWQQLQ